VNTASVEAELTIERLASDGDGVGRLPDGRVAFVPFTAPGDRVRVRVVAQRARHVRATVRALLTAGPGRTAPACAVFGQCGGCRWQHLDSATQIEAKRARIGDALLRIAKLDPPDSLPLIPSPVPYAYRGRARVLVQGGRVGFRRARSHVVCPTTGCPVLVPTLEAALAELAADPPRTDGEWELVADVSGEVRRAPCTPESLPRPGAPDRAQRDLRRAPRESSRDRVALHQDDEDPLFVSPHVFAQSNVRLIDAMVDAVIRAAGEGELAVELFAGAGLFTRGLARHFARIVAIEANHAAARDLAANLRSAGLDNVTPLAERVEDWMERRSDPRSHDGLPLRPDVVVLDPPRRGLAPGAADALARLGAQRIVYLSCDPATWARDLAVLADRGYELGAVTGFDLFPQTPHVETLAVMTRR
jgi:23S rRNA (uracil1939-C5)-methyltransferase